MSLPDTNKLYKYKLAFTYSIVKKTKKWMHKYWNAHFIIALVHIKLKIYIYIAQAPTITLHNVTHCITILRLKHTHWRNTLLKMSKLTNAFERSWIIHFILVIFAWFCFLLSLKHTAVCHYLLPFNWRDVIKAV